ncbi:MAG: DUF4160 domain-containing protein [Alphaproteobacteria bacterium]|nr:DUF4160 domain-containing protein [Alphaproteobacteria bacterium]
MPTVFRDRGYRFFFYSNEGSPREPVHIHVEKGSGVAKFWIDPVQLSDSDGFNRKELKELADIIEAHQDWIERAWHEHFG